MVRIQKPKAIELATHIGSLRGILITGLRSIVDVIQAHLVVLRLPMLTKKHHHTKTLLGW